MVEPRQTQAVLHLRGAPREEEVERDGGEGGREVARRQIQWAEDVIDNEGLGRKKSKGKSAGAFFVLLRGEQEWGGIERIFECKG
jgi:hypothetical protein